jgi:hypothetical protein
VFSVSACGPKTAALPSADEDRPSPAAQAKTAVEAFVKDPQVATLLALLGRSHERVRTVLGPHELRAETHFSVAADEPRGRLPRAGERIEEAFDVADTLTLRWADDEHFDLRQSNDKDKRREIVMVGKQVYTRLHEETWWQREVDGSVHELWLDDALRSAHDVLELAAPRLSIAVSDTTIEGRPAHAVALSVGAEDATRVAKGARAMWRTDARIDEVAGTVTIDAATGVWLSADIRVAYRFPDGDGRPQRGRVTLRGSVTPGAATVEAPASAEPLAERWRPELERRALLSGLGRG